MPVAPNDQTSDDPIYVTGTLAAGTNNIGDVDVLTVNGVAPQFDDTDKQAVSLYGKSSAAGDTAMLVTAAGAPMVNITDDTGVSTVKARVAAAADALGAGNALETTTFNELFNGTNWDRQRNNIDITVLASAARTTATNSADIVNYNGRFLRVVVNVTAVTGSASLTFTVKAKDALSGVYTTILASAAVIATGTTELLIGPGLLAAANAVANAPLPRTFRVEVAVGTADSATYSIGAVLSN